MSTSVHFLLPEAGDTFLDQLKDCYKQLQNIIDGLSQRSKVITITYFIAKGEGKQNQETKELAKSFALKFFGDSLPAVACVAQSPENGNLMGLEVFIDHGPAGKVVYKKFENISYVVIEHKSYKRVYVSGLTGAVKGDIYENSEKAFKLMEKILEVENLDFSNVVRQWNYIEDIVYVPDTKHDRQHYQIFNDVRSEFYSKSKFVYGFPAATGIGTDTFGVVVNFIAMSDATDVKLIPVANPEQIDAHKYSQIVLVGDHDHKSSPKFERGKLVKTNEGSELYISGTAAIVGEETLYPGDVEKQTKITINNIKSLVFNGNILKSANVTSVDVLKYTYVRAYVKYKKDIGIVKELCEKNFVSDCFQFLVSDICRSDLAVEIEGLIEF